MANKLYSYKDRLNAALGVALRRQYSIPLDVSSIFLSLADFQAYVKQDKTYTPKGDAEDIKFFQDIVPYSYPGQIISVIDEIAQTADVYVINKVGPLESNEKIETRYTKLNGGEGGSGPGQEQTLTLVSDTDGNIVLEKVNGKLNVTSDPDGNVVIF